MSLQIVQPSPKQSLSCSSAQPTPVSSPGPLSSQPAPGQFSVPPSSTAFAQPTPRLSPEPAPSPEISQLTSRPCIQPSLPSIAQQTTCTFPASSFQPNTTLSNHSCISLQQIGNPSHVESGTSGATAYVDLTSRSSGSDDDLPPVFIDTEMPSLLTVVGLEDIFMPSLSRECIDAMVDLCGDPDSALKPLMNGPTARDILQCIRQKYFTGVKKVTTDEEELVEGALLYYKDPTFEPRTPILISHRDQPAMDTGGVTRKFFSDLLFHLAHQDTLQLFVGQPERLHPAYSPQVLPLMKILGNIVGHSLLHEGPGFPFLAPYIFWYIATGEEQAALPYVSIHDLSPQAASVVTQVYCSVLSHIGYYICVIKSNCMIAVQIEPELQFLPD